ncbi:MAG: dienelactone hydrolase family protein [Sandarakinorhabdus sp.]|nr:dienelactone hydrolase family protein [Sandarakinorhabdus sp.]
MTVLTRPEGTLPEDLHISRRSLAALIAAGYAAAAVSADAAPITTSTAGLTIETVTMPGGLPGYVARPTAKGKHPAVIVVNEVFGVHEWIKDICRRLAQRGYVAIAPGFFHRNDPDNTLAITTDFPVIMKIVAEANNDQVMGDVSTTLDWLGKQGFVDAKRLAITGFCWGGGVVWMAAAKFPQLKAGAAWYGRIKGSPTATEARQYPIDIAGALKARVLGLYGALDKGIPVADVDAMQVALVAGNAKGSSIKLYPNSDHGFLADYRPSFNPVDGPDAWARMLAHFKANGV